MNQGAGIIAITWLFDGRSSEMIAVYTHNNLAVMATFAQRVKFVPNAGLRLLAVTKGDTGNVTVEVDGYDTSGTVITVRQSVTLQIADDLQTTDGHLHVTQNPTAVLDPTDDQWKLELQCGTFAYVTSPPFQVQWLSPSGSVFSSTEYEHHHFRFLLPNPVTSGNYTCRIPEESLHAACIHGNVVNKAESTLLVNGLEAQVMVLEAHQTALQREIQELRAENYRLNMSCHAVEHNLQNCISSFRGQQTDPE